MCQPLLQENLAVLGYHLIALYLLFSIGASAVSDTYIRDIY